MAIRHIGRMNWTKTAEFRDAALTEGMNPSYKMAYCEDRPNDRFWE